MKILAISMDNNLLRKKSTRAAIISAALEATVAQSKAEHQNCNLAIESNLDSFLLVPPSLTGAKLAAQVSVVSAMVAGAAFSMSYLSKLPVAAGASLLGAACFATGMHFTSKHLDQRFQDELGSFSFDLRATASDGSMSIFTVELTAQKSEIGLMSSFGTRGSLEAQATARQELQAFKGILGRALSIDNPVFQDLLSAIKRDQPAHNAPTSAKSNKLLTC